MSAAATLNPVEKQIQDAISGAVAPLVERQKKQQDFIEELLKKAQEPADKLKMSPEAYIAGAAERGDLALTSAGGSYLTPFHFNRKGQRLGNCIVRDENGTPVISQKTGKPIVHNFGNFWKSLYEWSREQNQETQKKAFETLKEMGMERLIFDADEMFKKTALAEGSGITGGYTVPPVFIAELLKLAAEESIVQARASKYPMTSRTAQIPSLDITTVYGGITPFLGGIQATWMAEAATRNESEPQFRQTTLTAQELSFYTLASNTLLADNAIGLDALLTQLFRMAIAWYTDYAYFQGNGVGKPMGILNAPATISVTRLIASKITYVDVGNMLGRLSWWNRSQESICWVCHQTVIPELWRLNDLTASQSTPGYGRLTFQSIDMGAQQAVGGGPREFGRLAGYPVLVTEKLPALGTTGALILVDLNKYVLGERMELQIDISPHVKFLNNQMAWRVIWRGDGQPWLNNPITLQDGGTSSTVSPFVVLTA